MAGLESETSCEIDQLKSTFQKQCKVIEDIGDYKYVVSIQVLDGKVTCKFQLTGHYPTDVPGIVIKSPDMSMDDHKLLCTHLRNHAAELQGEVMLKQLVDEVVDWIKMHDVKFKENGSPKSKGKGKKTKKCKKGYDNDKVAEEILNEKKPSMKTAIDVINRIQWDENLPTEAFSVGYWDRFRGIVEKGFDAFSWEDIATVDYTELAVPKHRIEYFKYYDVTIWNKSERLDNVFGSLGSGITITEVMERYEAEHQDGDDDGDAGHHDDSDSDSDDDGITVSIADGACKNTVIPEEQNDAEPYWTDKLRPNHFVSVRITNPEIIEMVQSIQDAILDAEPRYASCIVPPATLHVTLCVMALNTPEQISDAVRAIRNLKSELAEIRGSGIKIDLKGTDLFYNRVLYAKVHHDQKFTDFVEHLKVGLTSEWIEIKDAHEFVPHMTLMKTTRPVSREMHTSNINPIVYQHFLDNDFGSQDVDSIYLCSMEDLRQNDGFYITRTCISFDDDKEL